MNILFIIMHLTNGAIAEATVSVVAPKILCGDAIKTIAHESKQAHFLDESQKQLIKEAMTMALAESNLVYSEGEKKRLFEQFVSIAEHGVSATHTRRNLSPQAASKSVSGD